MQRIAFIILLFISTSVLAAENPWVLMTQRDLQGIRDILQENHPGPVDPQNHRYAQWLKDGFNLAMTRSESASSFSDYVRALGEEKVKQIRKLISEISAHQAELRTSVVVFDVRRNHGGDSGWGEEIAAALWGRDWVDWITSDFDNTADWRASKSNYTFMQMMVDREKNAGLTDQLAYVTRVRDAMKVALDSGVALARVEDRPKKKAGSAPQNPITGHIYFFTDGECASACLDFADLMRRLPNVVHVGLPTSADAIYIDNTYTMLPSGLAGLGYSMKVFRNRVRGNNEWYEPQIRWPGGVMTEDSITKWIMSLK
jgi:peptidase S41-like protein